MSKILGLGLPKTGINSLGKSLNILGYTSIVAPYSFAKITDERAIVFANEYDAIIGMLGYIDIDLLLSLYPDAKIIYTTRGRKSWVESVEKRFDDDFIDKNIEESERERLKEVFGVEEFNTNYFNRFWDDYDEHMNDLRFNNESNFLQINLLSNNSPTNWNMICEFLGNDIPTNTIFPKT